MLISSSFCALAKRTSTISRTANRSDACGDHIRKIEFQSGVGFTLPAIELWRAACCVAYAGQPALHVSSGSKCEILAKSRCFLPCLQQQTSLGRVGRSVRCQSRKSRRSTSATCPDRFNPHLVSAESSRLRPASKCLASVFAVVTRACQYTARRPRGAYFSLSSSSLPVKILTKCILLTTTSRSISLEYAGRAPADFDTSLPLLLRGHCRGRR
jgi:hypothetical protein